MATLELLPQAKKKEEKPHYTGHRGRLRERFLNNPQALPDYELLELILFASTPRADVKPLAKKLISKCGSLAAVLKAEDKDLRQIDGVSDAAIAAIFAARIAAERLLSDEVESKPLIGDWKTLLDYCRVTLGHKKHEEFHVLFMDRKLKLLANEMQQKGTVDQAAVYPREVVKRALELGASGMILMHNHPTGDPTPSEADVKITQAIKAAAKPLGITVHDHLIIGGKEHFSFKSSGIL